LENVILLRGPHGPARPTPASRPHVGAATGAARSALRATAQRRRPTAKPARCWRISKRALAHYPIHKTNTALLHRVTGFSSTTLSFPFFAVATSPGHRAHTDAMARASNGYAGHTRTPNPDLRSRCSPGLQHAAVGGDTANEDAVPSSAPSGGPLPATADVFP